MVLLWSLVPLQRVAKKRCRMCLAVPCLTVANLPRGSEPPLLVLFVPLRRVVPQFVGVVRWLRVLRGLDRPQRVLRGRHGRMAGRWAPVPGLRGHEASLQNMQ